MAMEATGVMQSFVSEGVDENASNEVGSQIQPATEVRKEDIEVLLDHDANARNWDVENIHQFPDQSERFTTDEARNWDVENIHQFPDQSERFTTDEARNWDVENIHQFPDQSERFTTDEAPNWDVGNIDQFSDLSEIFTTDQIFDTRQGLLDWVNKTGNGCGTAISIIKSDGPSTQRKTPRLLLSCRRRRQCPFRLKGVYMHDDNGKWKLKVLCGRHNHQPGDTLEENKLVRKLTKRVKPKPKPKPKPKHVVKLEKQPTKRVRLLNTRSCLGEISIKQFWSVFRPFIDNIQNVASDGHCGFRAVAEGLEMDTSSGWLTVREELTVELDSFKEKYSKIYGDENDVKRIRNALNCTQSPCPQECWFTLPAMGHLVASKYEVVFVYISHKEARTFVPLRSQPPSGALKVIAIGLVDKVHFVSLKLKPGCPIPPPVKVWAKLRLAERWGDVLKNRSDAFEAILCQEPSAQAESELQDLIVID